MLDAENAHSDRNSPVVVCTFSGPTSGFTAVKLSVERSRMFADRSPYPPYAKHLRSVHAQKLGSRSADRRQRDDLRGVFAPSEVIAPVVQVGMKKANRFADVRIDCRSSVLLVSIACRARETEVRERRLTPRGAWNDVFDFERCGCQVNRCATVCATLREMLRNLPAEFCRDVGAHASVATSCFWRV